MKAENITRRGILSILSSFYDPLAFASPFAVALKQNIARSLSGGVELGYNGARKISKEVKMVDI